MISFFCQFANITPEILQHWEEEGCQRTIELAVGEVYIFFLFVNINNQTHAVPLLPPEKNIFPVKSKTDPQCSISNTLINKCSNLERNIADYK